ncbi:MAG: C39 family peptidase [Lachnospiraceae bacterium]|nr:C39 family peptidase [Lachnospiraceae bacterium]
MKRTLIMSGVIILVLLVSMIVTSLVINTESIDMTTEMSQATLPVLYTVVNDERVNLTHGYTMDMNGSYLRGSITPLNENREIGIVVDTFGTLVSSAGYEVRSMDMERLVEDQVLEDYTYIGTEMSATIHIKDLISPDTEYMLIVKLSLPQGVTARYYVRFIDRQELNLEEELAFAKDFSERTFDREAAQEIKKYMESNSEGDNTSFEYVNIHSNFNQLTWGDLAPELIGEKEVDILDVDTENACIELNYRVGTLRKTYDIREYFRIKKGSDRIYLMEYERTMDQIIDNETEDLLINDKLIHGIISRDIEYRENEAGNLFCFIQGNRLYSYNAANNNLARIFSFWDEDNDDVRTRFNEHGIKIMSMDEQGSMQFMVYGYMNRGDHEGEEGIAIYYYDSVINATEEQIFIPYDRSYVLLEHNVKALSHINYNGIFYLYLDGTVYEISIDNKEYKVIADELDEMRFVSNADNSVIAWQPEKDVYYYNRLKIMSLDGDLPVEIGAGSAEIMIPLGFMDKDLIFGKIKTADIKTDETGSIVLPMYSVCIINSGGKLLKEYSQPGYYIEDVEFISNIINLKRLTRDETGAYIPAPDDQIISNVESRTFKNNFSYVVTEEMETTYQTELYKHMSDDPIKVTNPREVLFEGDRRLIIENDDLIQRFYVYAKGDIDSIYTEGSDAVKRASEIFGNVVDDKCAYIWEAGNRKSSARLEDITEARSVDEKLNSIKICVDEMLKHGGVYKDADELMDDGTVLNILSTNLTGSTALDLTGCDLDSVLYYVSSGSPVMVFVENSDSVLIVGYDSKNTVIYDPVKGTIEKKGMNDSKEWFEANRNRFITYTAARE